MHIVCSVLYLITKKSLSFAFNLIQVNCTNDFGVQSELLINKKTTSASQSASYVKCICTVATFTRNTPIQDNRKKHQKVDIVPNRKQADQKPAV